MLFRSRYQNTTSYFLRLPDGSFDGTLPFSLQRFYNNELDSISSVDQTASYQNWSDLKLTVRGIINNEKAGISEKWIRYPDPVATLNPNDNSDHLYSGLLIQDAIQTMTDVNQHLYKTYITGYMSKNLSKDETKLESALFAAYCMGITISKYPTDWVESYTTYLDKNFYRVIEESDTLELKDCIQSDEPTVILFDCFPNPAFESVEIKFELKKPLPVTIEIFNEECRLCITMLNEKKEAGIYSLKTNAGNLKEGIYLVKLSTPAVIEETSFIVSK